MNKQMNYNNYGFIYLTTNHINGKQYIGQRKYHPKNPISDEKYMGSGNNIKHAIKKYGIENFSKIILEECKSAEELNEAEKKWILEYNAVNNPLFYNIAKGGLAGDNWSGRSNYSKMKFKNIIAESNKRRHRDISKISGERNPAFGRHWYKDVKNRKQYFLFDGDELIEKLCLVKGMFRSKKHNEKISKANKGKHKNYTVNAKGKIAVSKGDKVILIKPEMLEEYIEHGYEKGNNKLKNRGGYI